MRLRRLCAFFPAGAGKNAHSGVATVPGVTRTLRTALLAPAVAALSAALLAGCSGDTSDSTTASSSTSTAAAAASSAKAAATCPTGKGEAKPQWDFAGKTGNVKVTAATDATRPVIDVTTPFAVDETTVQTLTEGSGQVVTKTDTVTVCYEGVNGRDGKVFDSAYDRGQPVQFPLDGVVAGFAKAITGQKVGSDVAVAMTSADGYPEGQPAAGIEAGDNLVFEIKIVSAS